MSVYTCPRCGSHVTEAPAALTALLDQLPLPRKERLAATAILDAFPKFASKAELVWRMWDAEGEDCDKPEEVVQSHVSKLRSKLAGTSWTIESKRYLGYRFSQIVAEAA
jgi:DNA-binding response OmpR family regulator